jgi:TonB-linked SusC/RagA family outer membrane protein
MEKLKLLLIVFFIGLSFNSWAQSTQVSGVVLDDQSNPLPGANVLEKGTTNGKVTDFDGKFSFAVSSSDATLVISYVGFKTKEIKLNGSTNYTIQLVSDAGALDEVLVIGYGTVKKSDATGSVVSLNSDEITEMRKTDVAEAMQGRMAGVDVRRVNNKPGAPLSIKIRGNTVINNTNVGNDGVSDDVADDLSSPLYVIDGIFMDDLSFINPADIKSLDVLKDASATAIYGSRGANGVVIVTTKSGVEGKMQVTYDATFGVNNVVNEPDMYGGDEYVSFVNDVLRGEQWVGVVNNSGGTVSPSDFNNIAIDVNNAFLGANEQSNVANRNYTNWRELLRKENQIQSTHTVGMSGGSNGLVYNASLGYTKDEGLMGIEGFERYNISASLNNKINEKFTVGIKTYFAMTDKEGGSLELFRSSMRLVPTVNPYNDDGSRRLLPDEQDNRFINPLYEVDGAWNTQTRRTSFLASAFLDYKVTPWLSLKTNLSPEFTSRRYGEYRGLLTKSARNDPNRRRSIYNTLFTRKYNWDNTADFNFDLNEDNNLQATLLASLSYEDNEGSNIRTDGLNSDLFDFYNTGSGNNPRSFDSFYVKETVTSFAGRFNYNFKEKYLLTFTGRYDGASKLAEGNKWAFFPSAALAWKVSSEEFMQDIDWLSNLNPT